MQEQYMVKYITVPCETVRLVVPVVIMSVVTALITLVLVVVVVLSLFGTLAILAVTVRAISLVATVGRRELISECRLIHKPDHNMHGIVSYLWYKFHPEWNCKNKRMLTDKYAYTYSKNCNNSGVWITVEPPLTAGTHIHDVNFNQFIMYSHCTINVPEEEQLDGVRV